MDLSPHPRLFAGVRLRFGGDDTADPPVSVLTVPIDNDNLTVHAKKWIYVAKTKLYFAAFPSSPSFDPSHQGREMLGGIPPNEERSVGATL